MTPDTAAETTMDAIRSFDLRARSWVLLLLDAISRNGISPVSKLRFHRLVFLTNCLAPVYSISANDARIVKFRRGPFYPVLQWHLDRLVGQGMVRISHIQYFRDSIGPWMNADYSLDRRALPIILRLKALDSVAYLDGFLMETTKAYAARGDESLDDLALSDLTYSDTRRATGAVIDFGKVQDNLSVLAANSFASLVTRPELLSREDYLHLYLEYVERAQKHAMGAQKA